MDSSGKDVRLDYATSASVYDWNKDGKPDLIVGTISGPVWYVQNKGGGLLATPVQLSGADGPMEAPDGGPCATDWDGDGVMDLFLGADSGRLLYYHGRKSTAHPEFDKPVTVLEEITPEESEPRQAVPGRPLDWDLHRPLNRPKPSVCDWNGDGRPDLLVGDFELLEGKPKPLAPDKQKLYTDLRAEQTRLKRKATTYNQLVKEKTFKELGWQADRKLTAEESGQYTETFERLYAVEPGAAATDKRLFEIFDQLTPLMPDVDYHGFVWLFLHK